MRNGTRISLWNMALLYCKKQITLIHFTSQDNGSRLFSLFYQACLWHIYARLSTRLNKGTTYLSVFTIFILPFYTDFWSCWPVPWLIPSLTTNQVSVMTGWCSSLHDSNSKKNNTNKYEKLSGPPIHLLTTMSQEFHVAVFKPWIKESYNIMYCISNK